MRTGLALLFDETHTFNATFICYAQTDEGRNVVLVEDVYWQGKRITGHIWLHRTKALKQLELKRGERIEFEAKVEKYVKNVRIVSKSDIEADYGFKNIRDVKRIDAC